MGWDFDVEKALNNKNVNLKIDRYKEKDNTAGVGFEEYIIAKGLDGRYNGEYLQGEADSIQNYRPMPGPAVYNEFIRDNNGIIKENKSSLYHDPYKAEQMAKAHAIEAAREDAALKEFLSNPVAHYSNTFDGEGLEVIPMGNATPDDYEKGVADRLAEEKSKWLLEQDAKKKARELEFNNSHVLGQANSIIANEISSIYDSISDWVVGPEYTKAVPEGYKEEDDGGLIGSLSNWASGLFDGIKGNK